MSTPLRRNELRRLFVPLVALTISHIGLLLTLIYASHRLPPNVASHFNGAGVADGWMPRSSFLWTMAVIGFGVSAFVLGSFYVVRFFPPATINLPRREYWLAPERRSETFTAIFSAGMWLASLVAVLQIGMQLLTVKANALQPPALSSHVWLLIASFLAAVLMWLFIFLHSFYRPA